MMYSDQIDQFDSKEDRLNELRYEFIKSKRFELESLVKKSDYGFTQWDVHLLMIGCVCSVLLVNLITKNALFSLFNLFLLLTLLNVRVSKDSFTQVSSTVLILFSTLLMIIYTSSRRVKNTNDKVGRVLVLMLLVALNVHLVSWLVLDLKLIGKYSCVSNFTFEVHMLRSTELMAFLTGSLVFCCAIFFTVQLYSVSYILFIIAIFAYSSRWRFSLLLEPDYLTILDRIKSHKRFRSSRYSGKYGKKNAGRTSKGFGTGRYSSRNNGKSMEIYFFPNVQSLITFCIIMITLFILIFTLLNNGVLSLKNQPQFNTYLSKFQNLKRNRFIIKMKLLCIYVFIMLFAMAVHFGFYIFYSFNKTSFLSQLLYNKIVFLFSMYSSSNNSYYNLVSNENCGLKSEGCGTLGSTINNSSTLASYDANNTSSNPDARKGNLNCHGCHLSNAVNSYPDVKEMRIEAYHLDPWGRVLKVELLCKRQLGSCSYYNNYLDNDNFSCIVKKLTGSKIVKSLSHKSRSLLERLNTKNRMKGRLRVGKKAVDPFSFLREESINEFNHCGLFTCCLQNGGHASCAHLCNCSSACDHTACNCSHHHACHMGCGVCGFDLLGHRLASSANGSNGAQGSHGMTSTLFPRSKDGITKSVASEDDHSNVATPKNKYADSNDGKRANVTSPSGVRTNVSGSYDSDSSEEEEDVDECIICSESMKSELKNEIGVLDVCSHIFCFKCIKMWSDRANSCPLCKREFAHIRKVNLYNIQDLIEKYYLLTSATANAGTSASAGIGGSGIFGVEVTGSVGPTSSAERRENKYWRERRLRCIRKNKISKLKKIIREMINWYDLIPSLKVKVDRKKLQGEEEDEGCAICGNDDNWPQLLLCDNCDKGYHMYCLDPPLTEVPPNNWYCAQCNMEAGVTIAGETYGLRRGSTGTSGRSESTRGRRSRRHNSTTTESTRATRRSRSTRASSRSLLDTLLQEQAEELDMMSLEGRSGSGIVSRDSLENIIRDSIISISSTATNPRTSSLNTVATSGRRPRRRGAEAEALEEEVRTNLLSQVYMGLNRSMSNATRRATAALRNSIIGRAKRTRNNSAMERERRKRARISGEIGATMEEASVETGDIPEGILEAISEGILEAAPETNLEGATEAARARIENTQSNIERGSNRVSETMGTTGGSFGERSTSITNSILTRDFNPDIVKSNAARDWRTNRTMTPPSTSIAFEDANTENIKETVKGRLRRFNFKTKNVDQLIKESLESIDNYLAFNTVPAADIDLISQTTSTSTSALNRARLSAPTGNTESAPTGSSTANSIPSVTEDARNAGVADVTGHRNTSIAAAAKSVTSSAVNRVATEATWAPNTREYRRTTSILSDKIYDELVKRDIDRLITERRSINSSISDGTRPNIKSSEGTGATDSSDTATGREKKYTSFIYRYKTITSDYRERPRSQSRRQEPYINGKTVKYLF